MALNSGPSDYTYTGPCGSNTDDFGLMFYVARFYDPALGRFISADSVVPDGVQGYDRYAYAANNPILYNDPTGHKEACGLTAEECESARDDERFKQQREREQQPDEGDSSWNLRGLFASMWNDVGLGYITPEMTIGRAEQGSYAYEFYYRFGITTGGDSLVLYPFNKGGATPHFYAEGSEVGFTSGVYESGSTTLDQDVGLSVENWTFTMNYDQAARSRVGPLTMYHYAGIKQSVDLRGPTMVTGALAAYYGGPAALQKLQEIMSRSPAFGY